jgi:mannan endo-1,4-beta-mannosidase
VRTRTRLSSLWTASDTGVPVPIVAVLLVGLFGSLVGCTSESVNDQSKAPTNSGGLVAEPSEEAFVPFDVRPLLAPARKYFGAALDGAPASLGPVEEFATKVGKQPNMLLYYAAWGDQFDAQAVRNARAIGALPVMEWEPFKPSIADIADGISDDYIRKFATAVRALNLPVAISFAHEMNGFWYAWGTEKTSPADFVRAWRRVHDIFLDVGATNVIWVWSPNVVNPVPTVPLTPLYPGDSYVDWIGVVGYYTDSGASTFSTLFGPTTATVREFTGKPILILETGAEDSRRKSQDVADLFSGVAASSDVIGFIWFNYVKRADWRIDSDSSALAQFRKYAQNDFFGFDLNHL